MMVENKIKFNIIILPRQNIIMFKNTANHIVNHVQRNCSLSGLIFGMLIFTKIIDKQCVAPVSKRKYSDLLSHDAEL